MLVLSACAPAHPVPAPTPIPTTTDTAQPVTFTPEATATSTYTQEPSATPNPTPLSTVSQTIKTNTSTIKPFSQIDTFCWPLKRLQAGNNIREKFVYFDSLDKANNFYVWDVNTFHNEKLEANIGSDIWSIGISFDNTKIVVLSNSDLVFISKKGLQFFPLPQEAIVKDSMFVIKNEYPRSDGKILITSSGNFSEKNSEYKEGVGLTYSFYVFDPNKSGIYKKELFLPDLYLDWDMVPRIYFSPNMKYVLYMATPTKDMVDRFIVYDIEREKIVMTIPAQNSNLSVTNGLPHWLPDENVITAEFYNKDTESRNYYFVSLEGKESPITGIPNEINTSSSLLGNLFLDWSPNMHYLASADIYNSIYIWDNQAKVLHRPCLPNERLSIELPKPIWSIDGNYIVVTQKFLTNSTPIIEAKSGRIIEERIVKRFILDLANKIIYEIPENNVYGKFEFVGWINWEG
jgi:hypothetical protein